MALSEVYVDPSIAADSGTGTLGDPFGDLEYAIEQTTFDTTNGTRVNVKAGTAEVLAADLDTAMADTSVTAAWVGSNTAPIVIQGYTSVAGDGGIGSIDGGAANFSIIGNQRGYCHVIDIEGFNVGSASYIFNLGLFSLFKRVIAHGNTGSGIRSNSVCNYIDCYLYDVGNTSIVGVGGHITRCVVDLTGVSGSPIGVQALNSTVVEHNTIFKTDSGFLRGISIGAGGTALNNSIYANGSTDSGIRVLPNNWSTTIIQNNLIQGFNGAGGKGVSTDESNSGAAVLGGNGIYDCTTAYSLGKEMLSLGDNETLTASPFNDAANGDLSPVDVGNVIEGALPQVIGGGFV